MGIDLARLQAEIDADAPTIGNYRPQCAWCGRFQPLDWTPHIVEVRPATYFEPAEADAICDRCFQLDTDTDGR